MSQRIVIILIAALAALVLLITIGERGTTTSSAGGETFVPGLSDAINDVERVTVAAAGNATVATLERRPTGWVVTEKGGYTADVAKLRQTLVALGEAQVLEQKTSNPELYSRLGVEDVAGAEAAGVELAIVAPNRTFPRLILGNSEGSRYRYARRAGETESYLIDRNPDVPRDAARWVDTSIVDIRPDRVREVTITHPDGEVVHLSKAEASASNFDVADVPEGRELLYTGVANVTGGALRDLRLEDVAAAATPGPEGDPITVEVKTFDGLVIDVQGWKSEDESWITLTARAEPPASDAAADGEADAAEGDAAGAAEGDAAAASSANETASPTDAAAEAAAINARVGGWRYRIASYQFDQLTRRMSDLLKAPAA